MKKKKSFELFHFSLVPVEQLDIDTLQGISREDWLRHALIEPFEFMHRAGGALHWVPKGAADESMVGIIQRQKRHEHHEPPEAGGGETVSDEWQGAYVIIDPTHHQEGQRAAVENDEVGKPRAMIKSLVDAINDRRDKPYHIEVEALFDASRFWQFSRKHRNRLKFVEFHFVVPNMWNTESNLEADLRDTGRQTAAETVDVRFAAKEGVLTDNQKVRDAVEYSDKGAGTIRARSLDGQSFNSTQMPLKTSIAGIAKLTLAGIRVVKDAILGQTPPERVDVVDVADGSVDGDRRLLPRDDQ